MFKRSCVLMAAIVVGFTLFGYAAEHPLKNYMGKSVNNISQVGDKNMVGAFFKVYTTGMVMDLSTEMLDKEFKLIRLAKDHFIIEKSEPSDFIDDKDLIASKYITTAKSRNNVVRTYKPKMGSLIYKNLHLNLPGSPMNADKYRVLIEFDKSGSIISGLVREYSRGEWTKKTGARQYVVTTVFFGEKNTRQLENNIKNNEFQEYFIKEL